MGFWRCGYNLVKSDKLLLRYKVDIKHGAQWRDIKKLFLLMHLLLS